MSFDENLLSPRGLLVNNNSSFVCDGPNFSKLQQATQATLDLPYDDQGMSYVVGFTDKGTQELYSDILIPAMNDFYKITNQSMALESGYRSVGDVCKAIIELSAAAPADYDAIFDALERLYEDESDNGSLRDEVQAKMKERIDKLNSLSNLATDVTDNLRDAIGNVTEAQILVKQIGTALDSQSIIDRLRECHQGDNDSEDFDIDCNAVRILKGIIDKQNMQDDSGGSMENLQHAAPQSTSGMISRHCLPLWRKIQSLGLNLF
ncbi:uncharacterized protein TRIVIDRAFT_224149 [Trichoderma virens Gv29-8]|uniref:Uncharacterized protein n=1 Tax=Hypocrea virens (strain Gv29-8 / FGSC 10586) TaxID=413071 RepID=G9MZA8_HYPVG|nr:uncharacterized protein TRIVIDRAFT_224149 [Trichoderma virens Gv29-8]EHK19965.1 hypothetical protein TRIVIDRAFT_224149 [Trichoderma virens Gv29-8]UKZ46086.1 hypothetical protein TrVGV298_000283 [Trichoderma virens]